MLLVLCDLLFLAELCFLPPNYVLKSQPSVSQNVIYLEIVLKEVVKLQRVCWDMF